MSETKNNKDKKRPSQGGPHGGRWEEMYQRLIEYKEKHGDCLVPNRYEADPQLGSWVSTQRRHYKLVEAGEPSPMTQHRIEALEKIGFKWSAKSPRHVQWDQRFQALVRFKKCYGHTQVPINWEKDVQLANWISTQRQEYQNLLKGKTSRLDEGRIRLLNGIGFSWQLQRGGRKRHLQEINEAAEGSEVAQAEPDSKPAARETKNAEEEVDDVVRSLMKTNPPGNKKGKSSKVLGKSSSKRLYCESKQRAKTSREKPSKIRAAKQPPTKEAKNNTVKAAPPSKLAAKASTATAPSPYEVNRSISRVAAAAAAADISNARPEAMAALDWGALPSETAKPVDALTSNVLGSAATPATAPAAAGLSWLQSPSQNSYLEDSAVKRAQNYPGLSNDMALHRAAQRTPTAAAALQDGTAMLLERMAQNQSFSSRLGGQDPLSRLSAPSFYSTIHSIGLSAAHRHATLSPTTSIHPALSSSLLQQLPSTAAVARGETGASSAFLDLAGLGSNRSTHFAAFDGSFLGGGTSAMSAEDRLKRARLAMGGSTNLEAPDRSNQQSQSQAAQLQALLELSRLSGQDNSYL